MVFAVQNHAVSRPVFKRTRQRGTPIGSPIPVHFAGNTPFFSKLKRVLALGAMGLAALLPIGCKSEATKLNEQYQAIPIVQVDQRHDFLKTQLNHTNPRVRNQALDHLAALNIPLKAKIPHLLNAFHDGETMKKAKEVMRRLAAQETGELQDTLNTVANTHPWKESYRVGKQVWKYHYGFSFRGKFEFHYGPTTEYTTHYRDHGNTSQYHSALTQLDTLLK